MTTNDTLNFTEQYDDMRHDIDVLVEELITMLNRHEAEVTRNDLGEINYGHIAELKRAHGRLMAAVVHVTPRVPTEHIDLPND